jgi:plastocyanin
MKLIRAAIVVLAASAILGACASSQKATGATTYTQTDKGVQVQVLLDEYKIHMPTTIPPGEVTFTIKNTGSHRHNFEINGQGVDAKLMHDLEAGQAADLHVRLEPGTYKVWCPVGPHKSMGMRLDLTVGEQPGNAPAQ